MHGPTLFDYAAAALCFAVVFAIIVIAAVIVFMERRNRR